MAQDGDALATVDPEARRIDELVLRVGKGEASAAEREELALYADQDPTIRDRVASVRQDRAVGGAWLERVESDERLQKAESSRGTKIERGAGLALMAGGMLGTLAHPLVGVAALTLGLAVLTWSFVRVRLGTLKDDPYKDVKR